MSLTISVLKGPSGTGKGTRVCQLIEFLKQNGEAPVPFFSSFHRNKFGLMFPKHGFLFLGDYVVSNKSSLTSWSSMDMIHSSVKTAELGREVIKEAIAYLRHHSQSESLCLVLEGEPMLLSDKFRPEFMAGEYAPDHLVLSYFMYSDRAQYESRIMGRSGKPGGDSGWSRAGSYQSDFTKSVEESKLLDSTQCHVTMRQFDDTVWRWGSDLLEIMKRDTIQFAAWSKNNPMLRSVGGADPLKKTKKLW
ncbi:MAG: hypothetical protein ACRCTP_04470 [Aeromonas popoffii]|uniref:hypothetical protein n=1 Tax=Aeromonas popoffii TaxID=70856 RepID=UPI003F3AB0AE